jgi:cobalt-zinc-cadmium efflux system outer membrane protein
MRIPTRGLTRFALLLSIVWIASTAKADTPSGSSITVDQTVELALTRNPDLMAARQRVAEAQGHLRQAGLRPNPAVDFSVANGDILNSSGEREFSATYSHTFELGSKRDRRTEAARLASEMAGSEVKNRERLLAAEVRIRFAEALAAMQKLENAAELFNLTGQNLELAKARTDAGEAAPLEQGLLQVELNRINSDRMLFASQVEQAILQIKLLAGLPLDEKIQLSGSLEQPVKLPDLRTVVETALSTRADLSAARANEQVADAELRLAKSAGTPDIVVRGGYSHVQSSLDQFGYSSPGGSLVPLKDKDNIFSGGVSIVLPLRNRNQGNIEAAIARQNAARLTRESLERIVRQEVQTAFTRLAAAQQALGLFGSGVIGQSRENLKIVRGAYELGELRLLDVITEQRRLIEVQRAYADLLRDAHVAAIELDRSIGLPAN